MNSNTQRTNNSSTFVSHNSYVSSKIKDPLSECINEEFLKSNNLSRTLPNSASKKSDDKLSKSFRFLKKLFRLYNLFYFYYDNYIRFLF